MKHFLSLFIFTLIFLVGCKKEDEKPLLPDDPFANVEIGIQSPTEITNTSAQVSSDLQELDLENISIFGHIWSTSENPTTDLNTKTEFSKLEEGTEFRSVLKSLKPNTTYYVRPYITSTSEQVYYGQEVSFTTTNEFFKFIVDPDYFYTTSISSIRKWIIIYNEKNDLVDFFELENNTTYELEWPENPSELYNLHIFTFKDYFNTSFYEDAYTMDVRHNIFPQTITFKRTDQIQPIGSNDILVSNYFYDAYGSIQLYTKKDQKHINENGHISIDQYYSPDDLWVLEGEWYGGHMSYLWFPDLLLNQELELDLFELKPMTDSAIMSYTSNENNFAYIESANNLSTPEVWEYFPIYYNHTTSESYLTYYYPGNTFENYWYYFSSTSNNSSNTMIQNKGAHPVEFKKIDADCMVLNSSINNFDINLNINSNCDLLKFHWFTENDSSMTFTYSIETSPINKFTYQAPELPNELLILNPELLDLSNLLYNYVSFKDFSLTDGYTDYNEFYQDIYTAAEKEYLYLSKYIYSSKQIAPSKHHEFIKEIEREKAELHLK